MSALLRAGKDDMRKTEADKEQSKKEKKALRDLVLHLDLVNALPIKEAHNWTFVTLCPDSMWNTSL